MLTMLTGIFKLPKIPFPLCRNAELLLFNLGFGLDLNCFNFDTLDRFIDVLEHIHGLVTLRVIEAVRVEEIDDFGR